MEKRELIKKAGLSALLVLCMILQGLAMTHDMDVAMASFFSGYLMSGILAFWVLK